MAKAHKMTKIVIKWKHKNYIKNKWQWEMHIQIKLMCKQNSNARKITNYK